MRNERGPFHVVLAVAGCLCMLPIIVFMLIALWPHRELVSWLLLGLSFIVVLTLLTLAFIKTRTIAKVRLEEEALRKGRLYTHERLIMQEGQYSEGMAAPQRERSEPYYAQHPYMYVPRRQVPDVYPDVYEDNVLYYKGLQPLSPDSYDWYDEK